jgi:sRNA-binding carbon storage regulator CsrA
MLLLHRKQDESVICHKHGEEDKPLVVRVCEVFPTHVTIGFEGDGYKIIRKEIFQTEKSTMKGDRHEGNKLSYKNYYAPHHQKK